MSNRLRSFIDTKSENMMTAMIDIVFLLLIFFLCSTRFKQLEYRLDAHLPGDGQNPTPTQQTKPEEINLFVRDDAISRGSNDVQTFSMRTASFYLGSRESTPFTHASAMLPNLQRLASLDPKQRVLIRLYNPAEGDSKVPFFNIMAAMDACLASGLKDVRFEAPHLPF